MRHERERDEWFVLGASALILHVAQGAGNPDCSRAVLSSSLPAEPGPELSGFLMEKRVQKLV